MDKNVVNQIMSFHNEMVDSSIINSNQIQKLVESLVEVVQNNIEGDVVEFGCYVGESSKYLRKSLDILGSDKLLYVYDSFEGLPPLSEYEKGTEWRPFTLKTTEQVLVNNFQKNGLVPPLITKGWFKDVPEDKLPNKIAFAFLDGDFYDSIYDSLSKIYYRMSYGGIIMFHDFKRVDLPGLDAAIRQFFSEKNIEYNLEEVVEQVEVVEEKKEEEAPVEVKQEVVEYQPNFKYKIKLNHNEIIELIILESMVLILESLIGLKIIISNE
jgi:O-methyltransferase